MKPIYIAHPFGGEQENVEKVEKIIKGLLHKHPDCTFYSPLHATGFMYSQLTYLDGMEHCFEVLSRCADGRCAAAGGPFGDGACVAKIAMNCAIVRHALETGLNGAGKEMRNELDMF